MSHFHSAATTEVYIFILKYSIIFFFAAKLIKSKSVLSAKQIHLFCHESINKVVNAITWLLEVFYYKKLIFFSEIFGR